MSWRKPLVRAAVGLAALLVVPELIYLVAANSLLASGVIQRTAGSQPELTQLGWEWAYSPWPGRAYVSGLHVRVQDSVVQFRLALDYAQVDIVLHDLLHRKFHASRVLAEGVSYRFLVKPDSATGREARLDAFPVIEGFARPAVQPPPLPPPPTPEVIATLWTVQLDHVDADLTELWLMEYRYLGRGHVDGAFALAPLRTLWVGPALVTFEGGKVSVGEHPISPAFNGRADVQVTMTELPSAQGFLLLHTLTASLHFSTPIEDLGVADLYVAGLRAHGAGAVSADLEVLQGKLAPGSWLELSLTGASLQFRDYQFAGSARATLAGPEEAGSPSVHATVEGALSLPHVEEKPVSVSLSGLTAELGLAGSDLVDGLRPHRLSASLKEARVADARGITRSIGAYVPVIARLVLGDGPLTASATALWTHQHTLVRLTDARLGGAELEGAAIADGKGWNGAAAGHFGPIAVGLRLKAGKLKGVPFVPRTWLGAELAEAGIAQN